MQLGHYMQLHHFMQLGQYMQLGLYPSVVFNWDSSRITGSWVAESELLTWRVHQVPMIFWNVIPRGSDVGRLASFHPRTFKVLWNWFCVNCFSAHHFAVCAGISTGPCIGWCRLFWWQVKPWNGSHLAIVCDIWQTANLNYHKNLNFLMLLHQMLPSVKVISKSYKCYLHKRPHSERYNGSRFYIKTSSSAHYCYTTPDIGMQKFRVTYLLQFVVDVLEGKIETQGPKTRRLSFLAFFYSITFYTAFASKYFLQNQNILFLTTRLISTIKKVKKLIKSLRFFVSS